MCRHWKQPQFTFSHSLLKTIMLTATFSVLFQMPPKCNWYLTSVFEDIRNLFWAYNYFNLIFSYVLLKRFLILKLDSRSFQRYYSVRFHDVRYSEIWNGCYSLLYLLRRSPDIEKVILQLDKSGADDYDNRVNFPNADAVIDPPGDETQTTFSCKKPILALSLESKSSPWNSKMAIWTWCQVSYLMSDDHGLEFVTHGRLRISTF